ncbi:hypothetical protein MCOR25_000534 [Pyricularia grisea]|uniref:20S-pre-rRNA D-site endonuclease NOB1 n=1 Tax=Pyricularia grisea TaxID=148305 RepID=A0A6P8B5P2_PYRGI|nr:hypothetical protein PgNI_06213 [Pyricularia grisea]KAI6382723.1 hypothetical protein MCOR25_000534 [Pyricularia grisea]TLD10570.1 hypothetical protein PgNI_06213 [Pyricularia grisea]
MTSSVALPEVQADASAENPPKAEAPPSTLDTVAATSTTTPPTKPIHTLVLDTGPLIKGDPAVSTLIARAEELYTIPAVLEEIRDEATRTRINNTLLPFLKLRSPKPESIKFVSDFARRTGDLEVLSRPDIALIALTYELEIERNNGDWRLRNTPNQQRVNGSPPKKEDAQVNQETAKEPSTESTETTGQTSDVATDVPAATEQAGTTEDVPPVASTEESSREPAAPVEELKNLNLDASTAEPDSVTEVVDEEDSASDDGDGEWITPSNIKKHKAKDNPTRAPEQPIQRVLQAALLTSDFAMQNVSLRINLNVVSPTLARITHLKSWVLRCHGCFAVTRQMEKQFCPKCGQPTLTRTSCSTDTNGNFKVHLKRNFQWNNRGNVFSIPKPVHGTASGKKTVSGGGKNGWGKDLLLAEDQKEYQRKVDDERRARVRDLMDEDYLPGILTGERAGGNGRIKVGAGRNVNGKKRR